MSEKPETCTTCKFWMDYRCRRYPPQTIMAVYAQYPTPTPEQAWPIAFCDDWCGEFVEKEVPSDE